MRFLTKSFCVRNTKKHIRIEPKIDTWESSNDTALCVLFFYYTASLENQVCHHHLITITRVQVRFGVVWSLQGIPGGGQKKSWLSNEWAWASFQLTLICKTCSEMCPKIHHTFLHSSKPFIFRKHLLTSDLNFRAKN